MSQFPLYDQLLRSLETTPVTIEEDDICSFCIENISSFTEIEHEIIYALIKMYQVYENHKNIYELPYNGKRFKKSVKFDFENFPDKLKHILYKFCLLHLDNMS